MLPKWLPCVGMCMLSMTLVIVYMHKGSLMLCMIHMHLMSSKMQRFSSQPNGVREHCRVHLPLQLSTQALSLYTHAQHANFSLPAEPSISLKSHHTMTCEYEGAARYTAPLLLKSYGR